MKNKNIFAVVILAFLVIGFFIQYQNSLMEKCNVIVRQNPNNVQIRSELSQTRANAHQYYFDTGGQYLNFLESDEWNNIYLNIPDCSKEILGSLEATGNNSELNSYQISLGDSFFVGWAPFCILEDDYNLFYCVDSGDDVGIWIYQENEFQKNKTNCKEVFGEHNRTTKYCH